MQLSQELTGIPTTGIFFHVHAALASPASYSCSWRPLARSHPPGWGCADGNRVEEGRGGIAMDREGSSKGWPTMEVLELASVTSARAPVGGGMRCSFLELAPVRREELIGSGGIVSLSSRRWRREEDAVAVEAAEKDAVTKGRERDEC